MAILKQLLWLLARLPRKAWLVLILIGVAFAAALWFLPWWASLTLIALFVMPLIFIPLALLVILKAAGKQIGNEFNTAIGRKESRSSLAAGQAFRGNGFTFTFPVACDVTQTVIEDFEALIVKPKLHPKREPGDSMMIVSTIPKDEMKSNITSKLDEIFSKIEELQASDFAPIQIGSLSGECRTFEASRDGKSVRGESAYLGDKKYSVAWQIITARDSFEPIAAKYRELASLIQRVSGLNTE